MLAFLIACLPQIPGVSSYAEVSNTDSKKGILGQLKQSNACTDAPIDARTDARTDACTDTRTTSRLLGLLWGPKRNYYPMKKIKSSQKNLFLLSARETIQFQ